MTSDPPQALSVAELKAFWENEEIPHQGRHQRRRETIVLLTGLLVSLALGVVGAFFAVLPDTPESVRTMCAGWVGVVLGQAKKVWEV